MAKKAKKKAAARFLQFAPPKVLKRPAGSTPKDLVLALAAAVLTGELPAGWSVQQGWRNSPKKPFKYANVETMVSKSANRGGDFNALYLNRYLRKRANQYGVELRSPREATEEEEELFERDEERIRERESGEFEELARKQKRAAAEQFEKRSNASKEGWKTRRANAAKKRKARRKSR